MLVVAGAGCRVSAVGPSAAESVDVLLSKTIFYEGPKGKVRCSPYVTPRAWDSHLHSMRTRVQLGS